MSEISREELPELRLHGDFAAEAIQMNSTGTERDKLISAFLAGIKYERRHPRGGSTITFTLPTELEHVEIEVIKFTIGYYHGDKKAAAKALGISLKTIYNKLEKDQARARSARP
jgi:DNA-binding NtrC family response regulator